MHRDTPPRIYPVIAVADERQASEQARVAFDHDITGVFLIDHDADTDRLGRCIAAVRNAFPEGFIGASLVRTAPADALLSIAGTLGGHVPLDALWTDDAGLRAADPAATARALDSARSRTAWAGLHFGGVAFKYQTLVPDADLPALGALARQHVDVPTTSGPGTGQAIARDRLRLLRQGLGDHPLALASGVTAENVLDVAPLVDHVLVSTGISDDDGIAPTRLVRLLTTLATAYSRDDTM